MKKFSGKILFFFLTIMICQEFTKMSHGESLVHKDGWKIHELDSSTENNLGIFGFHKGKPRLKEAGRFFSTDADKAP